MGEHHVAAVRIEREQRVPELVDQRVGSILVWLSTKFELLVGSFCDGRTSIQKNSCKLYLVMQYPSGRGRPQVRATPCRLCLDGPPLLHPRNPIRRDIVSWNCISTPSADVSRSPVSTGQSRREGGGIAENKSSKCAALSSMQLVRNRRVTITGEIIHANHGGIYFGQLFELPAERRVYPGRRKRNRHWRPPLDNAQVQTIAIRQQVRPVLWLCNY